MGSAVPPYFDQILVARRAGYAGRDVHLGFWDDPPPLSAACTMHEFADAQARLTQLMVELCALAPQQRLLDVGCGLGGALEALNASISGITLTGVNIDPRQLSVCQELVPRAGNSLQLAQADACALPFRSASFDCVLCLEAIFHFTSRAAFFAEAARVLVPGGHLVISDILLRRPDRAAPWGIDAMVDALRRDYGPWPEVWIEYQQLVAAAAATGLSVLQAKEWTQQTLPGYRITAPQRGVALPRNPDAGQVLRWLHVSGWLTYVGVVFQRPAR